MHISIKSVNSKIFLHYLGKFLEVYGNEIQIFLIKYANNMGKKFEKQYFTITPILSAILKKICEILEFLDKMGAHFREFTVTTNIFQSAHPPWSL